jgi:hypothetical protein
MTRFDLEDVSLVGACRGDQRTFPVSGIVAGNGILREELSPV